MLQKNAEKVNRIMCLSLAFCSVAFLVLLGAYNVGLFGFEKSLIYIIVYFGFFACLSPIILYHINVSPEFLKYYSLIVVALLIGQLGTFTSIGIYITYVLVPVLSCIYYDKKFTLFCSILCYCMMVYGIWFNTARRWEVKYLHYTHIHTFVLYFIGFTIEYLIITIFLYNLVKRSYALLEEQHNATLRAMAQEEKYKLLIEGTTDIIFEFDAVNKKYIANRKIYDPSSVYTTDIVVNEEDGYIVDNDNVSFLVNKLCSVENDTDFVEDDFNLSYVKDGIEVPLWYHMEAHTIKDDDTNELKFIGRLVNITASKLSEMNKNHDKLSTLYMENLANRNSLVSKLLSEKDQLTDNDYIKMSESHEFIAEINDYLKLANDLDEAINTVVDRVATYLKLDRIAYLLGESSNGDMLCSLKFQWNSDPANEIREGLDYISRDDVISISKAYDKIGYIEYNKADGNLISLKGVSQGFINEFIIDKCLGNQIWMPSISEGMYNGAFFFDRFDLSRYTYAEKFVMVQFVNTVISYINRVNAEKSNASKSIYLSNMSHEIRTPMNAILGMAEIALRNPMSDELRKCIRTIQSSAQGLLAIINDILDFSKIESGKIDIINEEYDILALINDVSVIAKERNSEKRLNLSISYDENIPSRLYGDVVRIKQVMINLANNAIKYTDSGFVDIYIGYEKLYANRILLNFRVEDSGQGIKEDELKTLFELYSQANKDKNHHKEGTGLGLAIAKQFVELMGGRIFVVSTYSKGSTFSFEVPQKVINSEKAGSLLDYDYESDDNNTQIVFTAPDAKVLLVDDNEINIEVAKLLFEPIGFEIDVANNGREAVDKTLVNQYDLIFMDHFMPVMDGMEATKCIREDSNNSNNETSIIALTADAISGVKEQFMAAGVNDYLTKPIVTDVAFKKIRKWLPKDKIVEG